MIAPWSSKPNGVRDFAIGYPVNSSEAGFVVVTSGADGSAGVGGAGGAITFANSSSAGSWTGGGCFNRGNLTSIGGNGTAGGGKGGDVKKDNAGASEDGPCVFASDILTHGGNGTAAAAPGAAGGGVRLISRGGNLRVAGSITTFGGTGNGAIGGNGGVIFLAADAIDASASTLIPNSAASG